MSHTFTEDMGDGSYRTYEFDERGNLLSTARHQYVSLVTDRCEMARQTTNNGYSQSREMQIFGSLPVVLANELHRDGRIWDDKWMARNIWNNSDYKDFRIGGGRV